MSRTLLYLLFLISSSTFGAIDFEDAIFPEIAVSARAQGLGNAFICKVDDSAAAFYNPAGLGTVRNSHFHLINAHIEMSKGLINTAGGGSFTEAVSNFTKGFNLEGNRKLLLENRGEIIHGRYQTTPNVIFRFLTAGFLLNKTTRATLGKGSADKFEYADRINYGPYGAFAIPFFGGIFKLGATGILLGRHEAQGEADANTSFELGDDDVMKGTMLQVIGGARLTLPWFMLPTFAATVHNAAKQSFSGRGDGGAPPNVKQQIDVGVSITPQIGKVVRLHIEANYKDMSGAHTDVAASRKIVAGVELDLARTFFIRGGYGDGYGSFGVGMRTSGVEFDFTSYAVESNKSEDRRFSFSLSAGF